MSFFATVLTLGFLLASASVAQTKVTEHTFGLEEGAASAPATLESAAFLAGSWVGTGLGGEVEEIWTAPSAGTMVGSFKLRQNGEDSFYEFFVISEEEGSLVLRLKHFNPDLTGWEEKDDFVMFPLVKVDDNSVYFRGLTYRKVGDDRLEIYLALHSGGETNEVSFEMKRR